MNMNKKTLFLILLDLLILFPFAVKAADAPKMIGLVKDAFVTIGWSIIIIGWVIAGILWLVSAGSPEKTGIAKKATWAAVIGTVVIILAQHAQTTVEDLLKLGAG